VAEFVVMRHAEVVTRAGEDAQLGILAGREVGDDVRSDLAGMVRFFPGI
jgi:hypothetical protein